MILVSGQACSQVRVRNQKYSKFFIFPQHSSLQSSSCANSREAAMMYIHGIGGILKNHALVCVLVENQINHSETASIIGFL